MMLLDVFVPFPRHRVLADDDRPCPYALTTAWIADPASQLQSGQFSHEARETYAHYVAERTVDSARSDEAGAVPSWIRWCLSGRDPWHPYDIGREQIGVWASCLYPSSVRSRAVAVSAVRAWYTHLYVLGVCDGIEKNLTRQALAGEVPKESVKKGLGADAAGALRSAADRYRGADELRVRAVVYLLLNSYLGGEILRPGQIIAMRVDGLVREQHRTMWKVPQKNASEEATAEQLIAPPVADAIAEYVAHGRAHNAKYGSSEESGPLLTGDKPRGGPIVHTQWLARTVNTLVNSSEELRRHRGLKPDNICRTYRPGVPVSDDQDL